MDKDITSTVFRSGNSSAVRLTGELSLPAGTRVRMKKRGKKIVIEAIEEDPGWSEAFLKLPGCLKVDLPRPPRGTLRNPFA